MKFPYRNIWILSFPVIIILSGLSVFRDYGMGWDELFSREIGIRNALFANEKLGYPFLSEERVQEKVVSLRYLEGPPLDKLTEFRDRHYGPFFELLLLGGEFLFNLDDPQAFYQWRHLGTHLFFLIGVVVFYFLLQRQFDDWRISLLGCGLLLFSPRIFAHSFFNSKDIPFLVACILCVYSLVLLLEDMRLSRALVHGVCTAIAIDIRLIGLIIVPLTFLVLVFELAVQAKGSEKWKRQGLVFLAYSIILILFTILFWPYLWENPLERGLDAFRVMRQYPWQGEVLFLGKLVKPNLHLPFYYIPLWVSISVPPLVMLGVAGWAINLLLERDLSWTRHNKLIFISLFIVVGPWMITVFLHSVVYDGWRHFFFVYPFLIILSVSGLLALKRRIPLPDRQFFGLFAGFLIWMIIQLFTLHPHQQVYFNFLAGKHPEKRFEMDYWGVSYLQGLKFLLDYDESGAIRVASNDLPGHTNAYLLDPTERSRLNFVELDDADYFMTIFRSVTSREQYLRSLKIDSSREIFSVEVGGAKILGVFHLSRGAKDSD